MSNDYEIVQIPLTEVYDDPIFNCRGQPLTKADVLDLIDSIKRTRLENPIVVQPLNEIKVYTPPPEGVKYRVLNGNRRYVALRCLAKEEPDKYSTIPAIIRSGLTDDEARSLNITDNLDRQDLTLTQEALALKPWYNLGYTRDTVGRLLHQSSSWVQIRYNILELPKELYDYMSKGLIGQNDIKELYQYRDDFDKLFARAKEIIAYRLRGQNPPRVRSKRQQSRARRYSRSRSQAEIVEMITHVGENVGAGLSTRLMAWCAGNATTFEILKEIKDVTEALGGTYKPIDEDRLQHL